MHNPYPNRPYPVGELVYPLAPEREEKIKDLKRLCMLEFGEQEVMFDMPRIVGLPGHYINLGHAMGGSAMLLARGILDQGFNGMVHSIDMFKDGFSKEEAEAVLKQLGVFDMVAIYKGTTGAMQPLFAHMEFAFVFIDADHSYEGVKNDFLNYSPNIKLGGVVAFHDTNQEPSHEVIEEYVADQPEWEQLLHVNRIKAFRRV